jgi:hypothetical protein
MDGTHSTSRKTTLLARRAASLALAACSLSFAAAPAQADPASDFAAGSAPTLAAEEIAKAYWQTTPCAGQVSLVWMTLTESVNATSTWTNPVGQYDAPEQNGSCQIAFNKTLTWDWTRFCSILVHEYGHLVGHAHADDRADVMFPFYEAPIAQCVAAAPAQAEVVAEGPVEPLPALKAANTAALRASSSSRSTKRGVLVVVHEPRAHGKRRAHKHRRHKHHGRRHHHHKRQHRGHRKHRVGRLVRA